MSIYQHLLEAKQAHRKLLAVLIDPEKMELQNVPAFFTMVHQSICTHIFVGGSTDQHQQTQALVIAIKKATTLPVILFPGDAAQLTHEADGLLFLSLLSGRNPEYLIEQHVKAIPFLKKATLEVLPTGYILVDGKKETAVQRVSKTQPILQSEIKTIEHTALAGQYAGKKLIYLEAGSGATVPVHATIIKTVKDSLNIPLIVGGGIRSKQQVATAFNAGADLVVIGTAFENDLSFFEDLKKQ